MLEKVGFTADDKLFLVGDYVDRGPDSYKMLRWLEGRPDNVVPVCGNHDIEFAYYIDFMRQVDEECKLGTDYQSTSDSIALYDTTKYLIKQTKPGFAALFDLYGTVGKLLSEHSVSLSELNHWADMIRAMPYYQLLTVNNRPHVIVHAGYRPNGFTNEEKAQEFYLYSRSEAYKDGGIPGGCIIAGHTPTIAVGEFVYSNGRAFKHRQEAIDCDFYNIDCGCVFRERSANACLACIRLEDHALFYV